MGAGSEEQPAPLAPVILTYKVLAHPLRRLQQEWLSSYGRGDLGAERLQAFTSPSTTLPKNIGAPGFRH